MVLKKMKKLTKLAVLFALVFSVSACTFVAGNSFYNGEGKHVMHGKNYHGKMFADLKGKTSSQVKEELGNPSSETKSMLTYKKSDLKKPPHDGKGRKPHKGKKHQNTWKTL